MSWRQNQDKVENLKCKWVSLCLETKLNMRKRGITTIPIVREDEAKEKTALVGADKSAV